MVVEQVGSAPLRLDDTTVFSIVQALHQYVQYSRSFVLSIHTNNVGRQ